MYVIQETQLTEHRVVAIEQAGFVRIFTSLYVSGASERRPQLDRRLDQLREGADVVVNKLDELGGTLTDLIDIVLRIEDIGAGVMLLAGEMSIQSLHRIC